LWIRETKWKRAYNQKECDKEDFLPAHASPFRFGFMKN